MISNGTSWVDATSTTHLRFTAGRYPGRKTHSILTGDRDLWNSCSRSYASSLNPWRFLTLLTPSWTCMLKVFSRFLHPRLGDIIVMSPATIFFSDIVGRLVCCVGICLLNNITSNFLKWGGETMNTNVITPPLEDSQNLMSVDLMSLWRKNRNFQQVGSFRLRIGI